VLTGYQAFSVRGCHRLVGRIFGGTRRGLRPDCPCLLPRVTPPLASGAAERFCSTSQLLGISGVLLTLQLGGKSLQGSDTLCNKWQGRTPVCIVETGC